MHIYPFFIECSRYVTGIRKQQLLRLGLGRGGLFSQRKISNFLVVHNSEFMVPNVYSTEHFDRLKNILWPENSFTQMRDAIVQSRNLWVNIKKKDKFNLIDLYILKMCCYEISPQIVVVKTIIYFAMLLKLINSADIKFENGHVMAIKSAETMKDMMYTFDSSYFDSTMRLGSRRVSVDSADVSTDDSD